jgi:hypothetical protein
MLSQRVQAAPQQLFCAVADDDDLEIQIRSAVPLLDQARLTHSAG